MRSLLKHLGTDTRYTLLGLPLAILSFSLLIPGLAAGLGTMVVWVGLPILAVTMLVARGFADVERRWLPEILDRPVARPRYKKPPESAGWARRLIQPLANGQSWLDLLHGIVVFPVAIVTFVVTVVWWAVTVTGLLYPLYGWIVSSIPGNTQLPELLGLGSGYFADSAFYLVVGAVFAITLPGIVRGGSAPGGPRQGAAHRRGRAARAHRRPHRGPGRRGVGRGQRPAPART